MRRLRPVLCALLLLAIPGAQARTGNPPDWTALAARFPAFAGAAVDVRAGRPRLTLLWAGPPQAPVRDLTDALGEVLGGALGGEARDAARTGAVQVRPARFTLTQLLDAERAVGGVGRLDPLLNRVVVPVGTPRVEPPDITVTVDEVTRESRLMWTPVERFVKSFNPSGASRSETDSGRGVEGSALFRSVNETNGIRVSVFVRPTSPARGALAADVRVVNTGRWPLRLDWDCFVVRLRVLDARGRDMTVLRDDEACAGGPPVILWPGEVRRAEPFLPVLQGLPAGRYRLRAELDVAGLRAAREATLDWRP